jgi:hypothetical protein
MAAMKLHTAQMVAHLLSPAVQVQLPQESEEVQAKLSASEVAKVFCDHVPGVQRMLFRQQRGQCVLKFLQIAYKDGWSAFKGTDLQDHLKWLMRTIVHYGHEGKPGAARYLSDVAEAFMDCQAVQARVVERVGLQIQGVITNFHGLVVALVGEYKLMALKMLAAERIAQGKAHDDATPTHYENRLTADLGEQLGLNADDVRRAALDEHAQARFSKLGSHEVTTAVARGRELFDFDAFVQALVAELNSFSAESSSNSLPRLFLDWASENMTEKHVVFDEDTCTRIEVDRTLVSAVLEVLFFGKLVGLADESCRGIAFHDLFATQKTDQSGEADSSKQVMPSQSRKQTIREKLIPRDTYNCCSDMLIIKPSNVTVEKNNTQGNTGLLAFIGVLASVPSFMGICGNFFVALWRAPSSVLNITHA